MLKHEYINSSKIFSPTLCNILVLIKTGSLSFSLHFQPTFTVAYANYNPYSHCISMALQI
jgi:hypothetical protein